MYKNEFRNIRCCFAGHSKIYQREIEEEIICIAKELIEKNRVKEFWVGNYGDFDKVSASAIRKLKKEYPNIKLELVLPYLTKEIKEDVEYYKRKYDTLLISNIAENTPNNLKIIKTNEYMVDNSSYLIAYVKNSSGGAYKTLEYAKRKHHIKIYNIL